MNVSEIPAIAARAWNALVTDTRKARPLKGTGVFLYETPDGVTVTAAGALREFRHPWQMRLETAPSEDDPNRRTWRGFVRPGFVNGRDVTIDGRRLTDPDPPALTLGAWRNPLASAGLSATLDGEMVALPGEGYPPFFASVGVRPAAKGGNPLEPGAVDAVLDPNRTRELRACDVVLITPRIATAQSVRALDPFSTAATVEISTTFVSDAVRSQPRHRLVTMPKWNPPREPDAVEKLMGLAVEPQTDELRTATVWMVSPPGADSDALPDESWTPYVQYAAFWNLQHDTRREVPDQPQAPAQLQTGIPFADFFGNLQLTESNDTLAQIGAYLSAADFSGVYWT
ncbi:hypothetical protein ACXR0O_19215 [Verrucomicrobiota bacterium sgz303538]